MSYARSTKSLEKKLDALFALTDIDDDQLRRFGKELQRLAADASRDDMLKLIFVRCLPQRIVTAITSSLGGKLDAVIAEADKAWTAANSGTTPVAVSAVSGPPQAPPRGGKCGGCQRGIRSAGSQPTTTTLTLCAFHKKFGDAARKCTSACSRWSEVRPRESQPTRVFQIEEALDGEDSQEDTASGNL